MANFFREYQAEMKLKQERDKREQAKQQQEQEERDREIMLYNIKISMKN